MAGFFQSFKSSSMPKRLLRYAVSRFDVFDDEALDLDNLDLAWGMNTVLEFRDVGLKPKVRRPSPRSAPPRRRRLLTRWATTEAPEDTQPAPYACHTEG